MIPSLSPALKQKQLAESSQVMRISTRNFYRMTSYQRLHAIAKRATPDQIWHASIDMLYSYTKPTTIWTKEKTGCLSISIRIFMSETQNSSQLTQAISKLEETLHHSKP